MDVSEIMDFEDFKEGLLVKTLSDLYYSDSLNKLLKQFKGNKILEKNNFKQDFLETLRNLIDWNNPSEAIIETIKFLEANLK